MNSKYNKLILFTISLIFVGLVCYFLWIHYTTTDIDNSQPNKALVLKSAADTLSGLDKLRCGPFINKWNSDLPQPLKCECGVFRFNNGITQNIRAPPDKNFCTETKDIPLNYPYSNNLIFPGRIVSQNETIKSDDGKVTFAFQSNFMATYYGEYATGLYSLGKNVVIFSFFALNSSASGDKLIMTIEGDLQIYDGFNKKWSLKDNENVNITPYSYAKVDNDGRIKVYKPDNSIVWSSPRRALIPGATMNIGESLWLRYNPVITSGTIKPSIYMLKFENFNGKARLIFYELDNNFGWKRDIGDSLINMSVDFNKNPSMLMDSNGKLCMWYPGTFPPLGCVSYSGEVGGNYLYIGGELTVSDTSLNIYNSSNSLVRKIR